MPASSVDHGDIAGLPNSKGSSFEVCYVEVNFL